LVGQPSLQQAAAPAEATVRLLRQIDGATSLGIAGVRFRDIESFAGDLTSRDL
jgi:hypothetical protein